MAVAPSISRPDSNYRDCTPHSDKTEKAAEFSFLIGIPAMIIASGLALVEGPASGIGFLPLVVAIISAFIAGYTSIGLFLKVFEKNRLWYFAVYCVVARCVFARLFPI
jgi:undecaprenyl-diphosphatase